MCDLPVRLQKAKSQLSDSLVFLGPLHSWGVGIANRQECLHLLLSKILSGKLPVSIINRKREDGVRIWSHFFSSRYLLRLC